MSPHSRVRPSHTTGVDIVREVRPSQVRFHEKNGPTMLMTMVASAAALLGSMTGITPTGPAYPTAGDGAPTPLTSQLYITAAANKVTAKESSPIRKCFREFCEQVVSVPAGAALTWDHYANNQVGHRWYYVTYEKPGVKAPYHGWMYCENITAPCSPQTSSGGPPSKPAPGSPPNGKAATPPAPQAPKPPVTDLHHTDPGNNPPPPPLTDKHHTG